MDKVGKHNIIAIPALGNEGIVKDPISVEF